MKNDEKLKNLTEIKELEKNGEINRSFKVKEIKKYKQKNKKITLNLVVYMIVLGIVTYLTKVLEKENLLSDNMIQHILYTISLLLRGTAIGASIVELIRKVKCESIIGYLENINVSEKINKEKDIELNRK